MNQDFENELEDNLLPEYDFANMAGGVRGKYVDRYRSGTNVVLLDPDVADAFPTAESVNEALRMLITIANTAEADGSGGVIFGECDRFVEISDG
jgi:hypothetical protein